MNRFEKWDCLKLEMVEILHQSELTRSEFFEALKEGRVCGDYSKRINIASSNYWNQWIFVNKEKDNRNE